MRARDAPGDVQVDQARDRIARCNMEPSSYARDPPLRRVDCDVGSAPIRNFQDLVHWIHLLEIDSEVGSELLRYGKPFGNRIDDDNGGGAFEPCTCRGAKPDGPKVGTSICSTYARNRAPLMGPSKTQGAVTAS